MIKMSEIANSEGTSSELEKPVPYDVKFPPFPEPTDQDFEEDIAEEERNYYKQKFSDLNIIIQQRLHCTACDRHLGCMARNESRMRAHPMLRTLMCHTCHTFYNSGEFEKGDDGSELYCRWCGQGGQVYCCSNCPHVFCAKCIRRNMGMLKIKQIENTDDWKCFKCNPKCLWDLRALCWALLRYCDLKNKFAYNAHDQEVKEAYQKDCATDLSECCKHKVKQRRSDVNKKREDRKMPDVTFKKTMATTISKIPSTIQVKKFASINVDETKLDKKPLKRPASPKNRPMIIKNPISLAPASSSKLINPMSVPTLPKKIKICNTSILPPQVRFNERKPFVPYPRIRPRTPQLPMNILNHQFNGYNNTTNNFNMAINDNINLSLESLTQGLDMTAVAAMANNNTTQDDDVVCTPDFPLEPLCEVTEDNADDDVQCITPAPPPVPVKIANPPPLVPCSTNVRDITSDNIIQMTENDVTVNAATGGLKFRVDPQTLSSNKMYRLPDGRIFAINANPNMPGGYSATIVAVTETGPGQKAPSKPQTFAAKLSAVSTSTSSPQTSTTPLPKSNRQGNSRQNQISKRNLSKSPKVTNTIDTSRECDMNVPIEWYRYNLIDAVDALEYSLSRLHKLKKEATSMYLRTRTIDEMRTLHRSLERLLNTSSNRFNEIKDNLNKELKNFLLRKAGGSVSDDDDDVEILPNMDENDDPIFIDENSIDSNINCHDNQEVDLTGIGSSEHNDSAENRDDSFTDLNKEFLTFDNKISANIDAKISSNSKSNDINNRNDEMENNREDKNEEIDVENEVTCAKEDSKTQDRKESCKMIDKLKCDETVPDCDNKGKRANVIEEVTSACEKYVNNGSELLKEKIESKEKEEDIQGVDRKEIQDEDTNKLKKVDEEICSGKIKEMESNGENIPDTQLSDDKLQDTEISDEKIQDADISDEKIQDANVSDEKMQDTDINDEKMQDADISDEKMQDADISDDKMQDADISDEMIETLLKDDTGKDSVNCT
ncbi:ADD domain-containing protein 1 [Aphomia sociella]